MSCPAIMCVFLLLWSLGTAAPTDAGPVERSSSSAAAEVGFMAQVSALNGRVATLELALSRFERSWYRDPAILISLLAFLFSFGTTVVSYDRTRRQDIHDARVELRRLIQRLSILPRENLEVQEKYKTAPLVGGSLAGNINMENALVAKQAAEVIDRIPKYVSSPEYLAVGNGLLNSGIADKAVRMFERAVEVAQDVNDEVGALRTYGMFLFISNDAGKGRIQFQTALNIFSKYPTENRNLYYVNSTHVQTENGWAQAELAIGAPAEARRHLDKAKEWVALLAPSPFTDNLNNQIREIETQIARAAVGRSPGA